VTNGDGRALPSGRRCLQAGRERRAVLPAR
jgi:hypothetical protein